MVQSSSSSSAAQQYCHCCLCLECVSLSLSSRGTNGDSIQPTPTHCLQLVIPEICIAHWWLQSFTTIVGAGETSGATPATHCETAAARMPAQCQQQQQQKQRVRQVITPCHLQFIPVAATANELASWHNNYNSPSCKQWVATAYVLAQLQV